MLATLYNVAVDLPLQESGWAVAFLWLCRCLYLFSYIRCYCCERDGTCSRCSTGYGPAEFQLELTNIVSGTSCSTCEEYNGIWVLPRFDTPSTPTDDNCSWRAAAPGDCAVGGSPNNAFQIVLTGAGASTNIDVRIANALNSSPITWQDFFISPVPDCMTFSNRVIPFVADSLFCTTTDDALISSL
jgi:hypothetical protein